MNRISIVGAGVAGLVAGERLARRGFQVDIVEKDFKDYTIKFLKQHPAAIHLDWATAGIERAIIDQKSEFTNLPTLIKRAFLPNPVRTEFIYPTIGGIGEFNRRLAREIEAHRGVIRLATAVTGLKTENGRISEIALSDGSRHKPDLVIWTAPEDICRLRKAE
jgi:protoporphyrinogen oxidase